MTPQARLRDAEAGHLPAVERRPMVPDYVAPAATWIGGTTLFSTAGPVPGAMVYNVCEDGHLTRSSL